MVVRSLFAAAAMFLAGVSAQEFLEDVVDATDFDAVRELSGSSPGPTVAAATATKTNIKMKTTLTGYTYPAGATEATLMANDNLKTQLKDNISSALTQGLGAKASAADITIDRIIPVARRQLSDDEAAARRLSTAGLKVEFTVAVAAADVTATNTMVTDGKFASLLKTAVKASTPLNGFTVANVTGATAEVVPAATSSSAAHLVNPSGVLSLFFVALVALKF